jgi:hypothetical protein
VIDEFSEAVQAAMDEFSRRDVEVGLVADDEVLLGFYGFLVPPAIADDGEVTLAFQTVGHPQQAAGGVILRESEFRRADWLDLDEPTGGRYLSIEVGEDRAVTIAHASPA